MTPRPIGPAARALIHGALAVGCAMGVATMTPAAQANVVKADWLGPFAFEYRINNMPDFDQRRIILTSLPGLPGNGGMHCVPTCGLNLFAYAATHGFPTLPPGNKPWYITSDPDRYDEITGWIDLLGAAMETDPETGTGTNEQYDAIVSLLSIFAPGRFTVTQQCASGTWSPTSATLAKASIFGGITCFSYGRYNITGQMVVNGQDLWFVSRDGGHCVTLVAAERAFGQTASAIEVRDPNSSDTETEQSDFETKAYAAQDELYARDSGPSDPTLLSKIRTMTRVSSDDPNILFIFTGQKIALIDSYLSIRPKAAYSFTTEQIPPKLNLHTPIKFAGSDAKPNAPIAIGSMTAFQSAAQLPDLSTFAVSGLIDGAPGIALFDPFNQTFDPIYFGNGIKKVVFGRNRLLYAIVGGNLQCFNIDAADITPTEIPWPFPPEAIAYDDLRDEIVTIGRFGINFAVKKANCPTCPVEPLLISIAGLSERPSVAVSPEDGTYWVWSDASPLLYQLQRFGNELELLRVAQVPGCQPTSVQVGDGGFLYVVCDGSVKELRLVPTVGGGVQWQVYQDSIFKDLQGVGAGFAVELSRTNFNPAEHDVPGWNNNILPQDFVPLPSIPDCLGDLNGDRIVNADDLGILLGAFGNSSLGDINVDQVTDADDLGILLGVFGQPCPDPI